MQVYKQLRSKSTIQVENRRSLLLRVTIRWRRETTCRCTILQWHPVHLVHEHLLLLLEFLSLKTSLPLLRCFICVLFFTLERFANFFRRTCQQECFLRLNWSFAVYWSWVWGCICFLFCALFLQFTLFWLSSDLCWGLWNHRLYINSTLAESLLRLIIFRWNLFFSRLYRFSNLLL